MRAAKGSNLWPDGVEARVVVTQAGRTGLAASRQIDHAARDARDCAHDRMESAMRANRPLAALLAFVGVFAITLSTAIWAADKFPSRPVHWVVGFAAGGPNDTTARVFGEWLGNYLGQNIVVEDRSGSGGMLAANYVI